MLNKDPTTNKEIGFAWGFMPGREYGENSTMTLIEYMKAMFGVEIVEHETLVEPYEDEEGPHDDEAYYEEGDLPGM